MDARRQTVARTVSLLGRGWLLFACGFPGLAAPLFTSSSSGRFQVIGSDSARNLDYARWAETMADLCAVRLDRPIPVSRKAPVDIILRDTVMTGPAVVAGHREEGRPTLTVGVAAAVDDEALREGFVQVVLSGLIERQRQEAGLPPAVITIPAWLTAGVAGNLDKRLLAAHRALLNSPGIESGVTPVSTVLQWHALPDGWHAPRAVSSLVVAWVLSFPSATDKLLARLASGEPLTAAWLADQVVGAGPVGAMEARWRLWRSRQERTIQEFGGLSTARIQELRGVVAQACRPRETIQEIRALTLGQAPELVEAGELYGLYFDAVARGAWQITQRRRRARAEAALDHLEALTRAREVYVDQVEAAFRSGPRFSEARTEVSSGLEKSPLESYLDEAAKRFDKRSGTE